MTDTTDVVARLRAMHKPRTERHGSGCVQCGIVWPCPTSRVLDEAAPVGRIADAVLSDTERQFLTFALDQAADEMSFGDGFTDEDQAALEKLRRMADEAQQPETQADGWHLTPQTLDLFVRALVNEVDYDIHKNYECGEEDGADHYPELVAEAAEMLNAITAEERTS